MLKKLLKPSSSAVDVRLVGCSLVVYVQTRSDLKNSNGGPSTCPIFLWKYSVMEQTPPHLTDCSTRLQRERKRMSISHVNDNVSSTTCSHAVSRQTQVLLVEVQDVQEVLGLVCVTDSSIVIVSTNDFKYCFACSHARKRTSEACRHSVGSFL